MSGVVKKVKKFVKKVVKTVVKVLPYIAMAAAVYFTAGLALSAFPSTAAFASGMPGFAGGGFMGLGIGEGAVAGEGIFSTVASAIGMGGGLQSGAMVSNSATALGMTNAEYAAAIGASSVGDAVSMAAASQTAATAGGGVASVAGNSAGQMVSSTGGSFGAGGGGAAVGGTNAGTVAAKAGMSMGDKLMLAAVGTQAIGAFLGPSEEDIIQENAKFQGSYFGMKTDGSGINPSTGQALDKGGKPAIGAPVTDADVAQQPTAQQGVGLVGQADVAPPETGVQARSTQPQEPRNKGRGMQGLIPQQELKSSSQLDTGLLFPQQGNVRYV